MTAQGGILVKCVVWDIDNTLLAGTYLESGGQRPPADPVLTAVLRELGGRGILHAIASRNPPEAAGYVARVTGAQFAAVECGWGSKADSLARIAADLGLAADALAFVDDDAYERAEVAFALPAVLVLSPEEIADAVDWAQFRPPVITAEGRRRAEMYAERRRRIEAGRAFGGSREDFLRHCQTRVAISPAVPADVDRLHELSVRTRQFNSAREAMSAAALRALVGQAGAGREGRARAGATGAAGGAQAGGPKAGGPKAGGGSMVLAVRLRDVFGDDGLVGGCVLTRDEAPGGQATWRVPLLMMSCRAMGRGVIDGLLAWLVREAARQDAAAIEIPCLLGERNTPLRLALASAGFRAANGAGEAPDGGQVLFRRRLTGPLPDLPGWISAPGEAVAR